MIETHRKHLLRWSLLRIVASVSAGVVSATGVLLIVFVIVAAVRHETVMNLYDAFYPRFRGGTPQPPMRSDAYLVFVAYVLTSVELALAHRRTHTL